MGPTPWHNRATCTNCWTDTSLKHERLRMRLSASLSGCAVAALHAAKSLLKGAMVRRASSPPARMPNAPPPSRESRTERCAGPP